jgi:hypothetical protein
MKIDGACRAANFGFSRLSWRLTPPRKGRPAERVFSTERSKPSDNRTSQGKTRQRTIPSMPGKPTGCRKIVSPDWSLLIVIRHHMVRIPGLLGFVSQFLLCGRPFGRDLNERCGVRSRLMPGTCMWWGRLGKDPRRETGLARLPLDLAARRLMSRKRNGPKWGALARTVSAVSKPVSKE